MSRIIGLTGGIATGKSTVGRMLAKLGAGIIDADELAREVVEPGTPASSEIRENFGDDVFLADGNLDRKKLGELIFSDPRARASLAKITHPRIAILAKKRAADFAEARVPVVIYEAALLVENRIYDQLDGLIVVRTTPKLQLQRLMNRDGLDEAAARLRIASQLPLEDKVAVATWVVDNCESVQETEAQVREIWNQLQGEP